VLYNKLKEEVYNIDFVGRKTEGGWQGDHVDKDHEGYPGEPTENITKELDGALNSKEPDIILLHVGTNYTSSGDVEEWKKRANEHLKNMLNKIDAWEEKNNKPIFVILAKIVQIKEKNDWDKKSGYKNDDGVIAYNKEVEKLFKSRKSSDNISLVDMYNVEVSGDGCHPSQEGYKTMANRWFEAIKEILPEPGGTIEIKFQNKRKPNDQPHNCEVETITKTKKPGQKVEIILPKEPKTECEDFEIFCYQIPGKDNTNLPGDKIYVDRSMTIDVYWLDF
jgi:lysophospholipase L1-like esterase